MKTKPDGASSAGIVEQSRWGWVALFASTTTLVCCALPILLVTLGLGALSAAMFSTFPALVTLAQHKTWFFAGSALLLLLSGWLLYRPGRACPADPALAAKCEAARRWNLRFFWGGAGIWTVGFIAAYLSLPLLEFFDPV